MNNDHGVESVEFYNHDQRGLHRRIPQAIKSLLLYLLHLRCNQRSASCWFNYGGWCSRTKTAI